MKFIDVITQWEGVGHRTTFDADDIDGIVRDIGNTLLHYSENLKFIKIEPENEEEQNTEG